MCYGQHWTYDNIQGNLGQKQTYCLNVSTYSSLFSAIQSQMKTNTSSTWGEQADGHEQHMLLLVQVQFFQTNLELHQRLQQLQSVTRYGKRHTRESPTSACTKSGKHTVPSCQFMTQWVWKKNHDSLCILFVYVYLYTVNILLAYMYESVFVATSLCLWKYLK